MYWTSIVCVCARCYSSDVKETWNQVQQHLYFLHHHLKQWECTVCAAVTLQLHVSKVQLNNLHI